MKTLKIVFIFTAFIILLGCDSKRPDWPGDVLSGIWIHKNATDVKYAIVGHTYQIEYQVKEYYPSPLYISEMVSEMTKLGWQRREHDFLNPTFPMSYLRSPDDRWGHIEDKDGLLHQWIDDWQDAQGNIIRYWLFYKEKPWIPWCKEKPWIPWCKEKPINPEKENRLTVITIYIPAKIVKQMREEADGQKQNQSQKGGQSEGGTFLTIVTFDTLQQFTKYG